MKNNFFLTQAAKITIGSLLIAALGVVIQILAGHNYPTVPPVFFILLIPAALIAFSKWWWVPISGILAGLFLFFGVFLSGASSRLFSAESWADTTGLWIQTLGVLFATIAAAIATVQNYHCRQLIKDVQTKINQS